MFLVSDNESKHAATLLVTNDQKDLRLLIVFEINYESRIK